jgi:hypothetical protein
MQTRRRGIKDTNIDGYKLSRLNAYVSPMHIVLVPVKRNKLESSGWD